MTTLYRPVLIESAEQAEALAPQTIVIEYADDDVMWCAALAEGFRPRDLLPETGRRLVALVPIEAEEEWKTLHEGAWHLKADEDDARRDTNSLGARRRYTTDWEEA